MNDRADDHANPGPDQVRIRSLPSDDAQFLGGCSRVVRVSRAQPPPDVHGVAILIGASGEVPSSRSEEDRREKSLQFEREAEQIADALRAALPGGTFDRLLIALLRHRVSQLVVSHERRATPDPCAEDDGRATDGDGR